MDILELAMEKERDEENHYRRLAERAGVKGLKKIFLFLADEEAKHCIAISKLKDEPPKEITDAEAVSEAEAFFEEMEESEEPLDFDQSQVDIYEDALEQERKGWQFYLDKAEETHDESLRTIFMKLAEEERKHKLILENIVEFVSRPDHWLENAEFFHEDEY